MTPHDAPCLPCPFCGGSASATLRQELDYARGLRAAARMARREAEKGDTYDIFGIGAMVALSRHIERRAREVEKKAAKEAAGR